MKAVLEILNFPCAPPKQTWRSGVFTEGVSGVVLRRHVGCVQGVSGTDGQLRSRPQPPSSATSVNVAPYRVPRRQEELLYRRVDAALQHLY